MNNEDKQIINESINTLKTIEKYMRKYPYNHEIKELYEEVINNYHKKNIYIMIKKEVNYDRRNNNR